MMNRIVYSVNGGLEADITRKHLIPYRANPYLRYEVNKWYYSSYWRQCFKVITVKYNNKGVLEDAYIQWDDHNYGLICTDLSDQDYLMEKDYDDIYLEDIVNSEKSYTGAQIVYWFYMNRINCFNRKYRNFWKFIDSSSKHRLNDFNTYKLIANENDLGFYINCKIVKDKS